MTVAGRRVNLTATEYELLRALSTNAGGVSTADELLRRVWGGRRAGDPNLLRTFVRRLRGKLGDDAGRPAYIFTERGVGYRLAVPGDPVDAPPAVATGFHGAPGPVAVVKRQRFVRPSTELFGSPQTGVGRGGASSIPPQQRNSIEMSAP